MMSSVQRSAINNHKSYVDLDNARIDEQRRVMETIEDEAHCPFCRENLKKYHKPAILKETKHWLLTKNQWPYQNTKTHLLAIYKEHAEKLGELEPEAGTELFELMAWAEKEFDAPGGGFAMRFGDTNYSAGTVKHLHVQFLVPDIHAANYKDKPVRLKIGKY